MKYGVLRFALIFFLIFHTSAEDVDYKEKIGEEASLIKDLGNLLYKKSEQVPKTDDIIEKINEADLNYEQKIQQEEAKENLEYQKNNNSNILCNGKAYLRDYSFPCPSDWQLLESGECWGKNYKGPCQALDYLTDYSIEDKKSFELKCCVSWPKLDKNNDSHIHNRHIVRGPVNHMGNVLSAQRI